MRNEYAMTKLAKEYLSKVKCCDESSATIGAL